MNVELNHIIKIFTFVCLFEGYNENKNFWNYTTPGFNYLFFPSLLKIYAKCLCVIRNVQKVFLRNNYFDANECNYFKILFFAPIIHILFHLKYVPYIFTTVCLFKWWKARWISWKVFRSLLETSTLKLKL